jgi:hypothetical protein
VASFAAKADAIWIAEEIDSPADVVRDNFFFDWGVGREVVR